MNEKRERPRYVIVVELDGSMPRRDPGRPHLFVALTVDEPGRRLERLKEGRTNSQFNGRFVRLRDDLNGLSGVALDPAKARAAMVAEKTRLSRLGHAVNGISKVWNCYVIDLEPPVGATGDLPGYVYVGQSEHSPEERFAIHKGPKPLPPKRDLGSPVVRRRGTRLNYALMDSLEPRGPFFTQADALAAEKLWALTLHRRGYRVKAGDATPRPTERHT